MAAGTKVLAVEQAVIELALAWRLMVVSNIQLLLALVALALRLLDMDLTEQILFFLP